MRLKPEWAPQETEGAFWWYFWLACECWRFRFLLLPCRVLAMYRPRNGRPTLEPPTTFPRLPAAFYDYLLPSTTTCCLPPLPAKITWGDKAKAAIESWIGEEMIWELFGPLRRPIPEGKVRLLALCRRFCACAGCRSNR